MRSVRRFLSPVSRAAATAIGSLGVLGVWVALAAPAGALAPQPVDASEQGPLAFVLMTVMVVLFVSSLFYMDRVRERRSDRAAAEQRRPTPTR